MQVSQGACPGRRLEVQFDHPSTFRPLISFEARAVQSTVGGGSGAVFEGSGSGTARIEIGTDRGAYDVTVRAVCWWRVLPPLEQSADAVHDDLDGL